MTQHDVIKSISSYFQSPKKENEEEEPIIIENENEAEEVEDEIEVVDFPLESLHLYDDAFEWLLNSSTEYCFISVIGKSRFGKSLSQGRFLARILAQ